VCRKAGLRWVVFRGVVMETKLDIMFVKGKPVTAFEYLCSDCKQLRLSFVATNSCSNCGSINIVKGLIGTLRKEG